ncbi:Na+/H+ antiporter NhaC [Photobacterium aquimaris]|uniref:Na+/H+ antiporter NhaC n=1 Tax=Photobacterium aquimaris TaxID=512643 RepID=A0A2T3I1H3_9GAMM|nr:Na+/H+ antiporter NhaC [Photobacterium aquimaris]MCP4955516.1 Na+/H+ antiporter NhaC [Photobacterium aquimaris]OBU22386.1 Na+/H+ antiporter NhaC [Photobacterium aquimaris]PQJ41581.1 Na+/H+ antiporter NhaC [Photobacterium aquimaris]PSU10519.1 Na+/H+ antiporter NhaC [Photobacterium aquimaris]
MEKQTIVKLPSVMQVIIALGIFLALAFSFTSKLNLPIQLALYIGWFVIIALGIKLGHDYKSLEKAATKGIANGLGAVLILLAVGSLVGTWIAGGIVPTIIYYGLEAIHPSIFLLATMIICSLTALATGTSWGAAGTAGIAMMGIGQGLGIPAPMTAGAVLSGCYFGDKMSPLSDSVILASSMSNVEIMEHIKGMLPISLISYIITAILFTAVGFHYAGNIDMSQVNSVIAAMDKQFVISPLSFIPVVVVLVLLAFRLPSFPVISFGSLLGIVWAIMVQGMDPIKAINAAWAPFSISSGVEFIDAILNRGGMSSMLGSVAVIIFGLGFGGLLDKVGVLQTIARLFERKVNSAGSLAVSTIATAFLGNVFGSAMYVSLILTPKICAKNYDRLGYQRKNLSRNAEFGGTLTSGMVPWSDNGIYMASILGVATFSYAPFMWLSFVCIIVTIVSSYMGWFVDRCPPATEAQLAQDDEDELMTVKRLTS